MRQLARSGDSWEIEIVATSKMFGQDSLVRCELCQQSGLRSLFTHPAKTYVRKHVLKLTLCERWPGGVFPSKYEVVSCTTVSENRLSMEIWPKVTLMVTSICKICSNKAGATFVLSKMVEFEMSQVALSKERNTACSIVVFGFIE